MKEMNVFDFLEQLKGRNIYFELASHRENAIMVAVQVPGERWEVEFLNNGEVEVEIFVSSGDIFDERALDRLFDRFSD